MRRETGGEKCPAPSLGCSDRLTLEHAASFHAHSAVDGAPLLNQETAGDDVPMHDGAGLYNDGLATVNRSTITRNLAVSLAYGGGIYNNGVLAANYTTISGNTASDGGGIASVMPVSS